MRFVFCSFMDINVLGSYFRLPTTVLLQSSERRRQGATFGHHSEDLQLQQEPVAADLAHGDGVHEKKRASK